MTEELRKCVSASYVLFIRRRDTKEEVLLLERSNTGYMDGYFSLPAGHVAFGEPPTFAALREIKEEIGVVILRENLHFVHAMYRPATNGAGDRADYFFRCEKWKGEILNLEPEKCSRIEWFSLDTLPENTIPYIKHFLSCYQAHPVICFSEYGWEAENVR